MCNVEDSASLVEVDSYKLTNDRQYSQYIDRSAQLKIEMRPG